LIAPGKMGPRANTPIIVRSRTLRHLPGNVQAGLLLLSSGHDNPRIAIRITLARSHFTPLLLLLIRAINRAERVLLTVDPVTLMDQIVRDLTGRTGKMSAGNAIHAVLLLRRDAGAAPINRIAHRDRLRIITTALPTVPIIARTRHALLSVPRNVSSAPIAPTSAVMKLLTAHRARVRLNVLSALNALLALFRTARVLPLVLTIATAHRKHAPLTALSVQSALLALSRMARALLLVPTIAIAHRIPVRLTAQSVLHALSRTAMVLPLVPTTAQRKHAPLTALSARLTRSREIASPLADQLPAQPGEIPIIRAGRADRAREQKPRMVRVHQRQSNLRAITSALTRRSRWASNSQITRTRSRTSPACPTGGC
jgi:hypothetical protein